MDASFSQGTICAIGHSVHAAHNNTLPFAAFIHPLTGETISANIFKHFLSTSHNYALAFQGLSPSNNPGSFFTTLNGKQAINNLPAVVELTPLNRINPLGFFRLNENASIASINFNSLEGAFYLTGLQSRNIDASACPHGHHACFEFLVAKITSLNATLRNTEGRIVYEPSNLSPFDIASPYTSSKSIRLVTNLTQEEHHHFSPNVSLFSGTTFHTTPLYGAGSCLSPDKPILPKHVPFSSSINWQAVIIASAAITVLTVSIIALYLCYKKRQTKLSKNITGSNSTEMTQSGNSSSNHSEESQLLNNVDNDNGTSSTAPSLA